MKLDDPALRIAFFALRYDQDLNTPIRLFARDEAGNTARARLRLHDVPEAVQEAAASSSTTSSSTASSRRSSQGTTEVKPEGDNLAKFLVINGELRRKNAEKIASFAKQTAPEILWRGVVFHPFTNNAVESAFADQRTYVYKGKEVDQQMHLGFDLASFTGMQDRRGESRQGRVRRRARHLRQLRDPRSRHGRAVALRPPVVDRREGRRHGREGTGARHAAA